MLLRNLRLFPLWSQMLTGHVMGDDALVSVQRQLSLVWETGTHFLSQRQTMMSIWATKYTVLEISHHNSGTGPGPQNFSTSTNVLLSLPPHFWPEAIWIETSFTSTNVKLRLRFVVHLTYHWHSPEPHLTTWPSSDLPLTLTRPLTNLD